MNIANFVRNCDRTLATIALGILVALVFAQVVMRVVFSAPLVGAEEFVRYLLIWVVFVGMPYTTRLGDQIKMDELQSYLPKWMRMTIRFLSVSSAVLTFGLIAAIAIMTTLRNLQNRTATLSIPFWIFFTPTILGFCLVTIESAVKWIGFFKSPDYSPAYAPEDDEAAKGDS